MERKIESAETTTLVERLRAGEARALARAITLVENDAPEAAALLAACFRHTGRALRVGITGAPGAGKSTLVDRLAGLWRADGKTVGVIAVDPSSPFTGGALLGDRIRFQDRQGDAGFYARSMATRGSLGGLAQATADVALLIEASGKDALLIETVGVGQDEVEIARLADVTLVVLAPGMGDDVQSLKAGVMEIADIYVVNKADREGADRVEREIRAMQSLARGGAGDAHADWTPPVVRTIGTTGEGADRLAEAIAKMQKWLGEEDRLTARRAQHWQRRLDAMLRAELMRRARRHGVAEDELARRAARIAAGLEDPWGVAKELAKRVVESQ
jgi:LAO/AO transport system kinase